MDGTSVEAVHFVYLERGAEFSVSAFVATTCTVVSGIDQSCLDDSRGATSLRHVAGTQLLLSVEEHERPFALEVSKQCNTSIIKDVFVFDSSLARKECSEISIEFLSSVTPSAKSNSLK